MRVDEQEIPSVSDELPKQIAAFERRKNKPTKEQIIKKLPPPSDAYKPLIIPHRELRASEAALALIQAQKTSPLELFKLFWSDDLMAYLAVCTNEFAAHELEKQHEKRLKSRSWYPTWPAEIGVFLGVILFKGIFNLHQQQRYWQV